MTQPTFMVIDDDTGSRALLCEMLAQQGYLVAHDARHGIGASEAAAEIAPDILFVSIEEPVARSLLIVDYVRSAFPGCVTIGYTSDLSADVTRRAMRSDMSDLLEAPLSEADVRQAVANALRALERRNRTAIEHGEAHGGGVFAVVGQKGGIGKTTIATNLASVFASRTPGSTIIIDLDTHFGDVALAMDVAYEFTVVNAARGIFTLEREEFRNLLVRHESGAYVLPSPESPAEWDEIGPEHLAELIDFAADMFDYVVLDTPGTLDESVAVAIQKASRIVTVTSLDLTSIKNTNLLLGYFETQGIDPGSVVLTVSHNLERNIVTPDDAAGALDHAIDYEIPFDRQVTYATQSGRPVTIERADSAAAHAYAGLASLVASEPISMPAMRPQQGLLARLLRRAPANEQVTTLSPATAAEPGMLTGAASR